MYITHKKTYVVIFHALQLRKYGFKRTYVPIDSFDGL